MGKNPASLADHNIYGVMVFYIVADFFAATLYKQQLADSAYYDDGERKRESRDSREEGSGAHQSESSRVDPQPRFCHRRTAVQVDEHVPDCSTVQTANKPALTSLLCHYMLPSKQASFMYGGPQKASHLRIYR